MLRKLRNYYYYCQILKKNWGTFSKDNVLTRTITWQFGTVINMPSDVMEYGEPFAREVIRKYVTKIEIECMNMHMKELVVLRSVKKIDTFNYKVVFDFYGFDTVRTFWVLLSLIVAALTALAFIL